MRSWPSVDVPRLPGKPPPLRLYDSATDEIRPTAPTDQARMYVCGITPYDATHLGHAATYLAFDLINRIWQDGGFTVRFVENVTDVDDPLIERAERDGEDWRDLAERETQLFREDMTALRILPPEAFIGAVESIDLVVDAVQKMLANGAAYRLEDGYGDVYFDISSDQRFGYVSRYDEATMLSFFTERGGDPDRVGKRHRLDPLLWKGKRNGDPSWPTDIGEGRPGWHVECSAIAMNRLGPQIDLQGGGSDLRFPHHEASAAHAEAVSGQWPFARHYTQAAMIGLDGEKMSKSRGNLVFVSALRREGVDQMAIRLALLSGHYRQDREWSADLLGEAEQRLQVWRAATCRPTALDATATLARVRERLSDDLDTPGAIAAIDWWADHADTGSDPAAPGLILDLVDALLGISLLSGSLVQQAET